MANYLKKMVLLLFLTLKRENHKVLQFLSFLTDHFMKETLLITRLKTKMDIIKILNLLMMVVFIKMHFTDKVEKKVKAIHLKASMSTAEK